MRSELETRLGHTAPTELLLPTKGAETSGLSAESEKMLSFYVA
jgi:hypothetical protein